MHTHITRDDRAVIAAGLRANDSLRSIARRIGKHVSTVSREIRRNRESNGTYRSPRAHNRARDRRANAKHAYRLIENDSRLRTRIINRLHPLVSPEVIAHECDIHHQTIYNWIERSRPELKEKLPQRGRKRRRYGSKRAQRSGWTEDVRPIDDRPEGSPTWEGDTVHGSTKARLLTHVEKNSLYTKAHLLSDGTANSVQETCKDIDLSGTVTYDRGSEFALWKMIERDLDVRIYFADAYSPWQRGVNENTNGRLRRVFPKATDFASIDQSEVNDIIEKMNRTPRKSLGWRTPEDVFSEVCCNSE